MLWNRRILGFKALKCRVTRSSVLVTVLRPALRPDIVSYIYCFSLAENNIRMLLILSLSGVISCLIVKKHVIAPIGISDHFAIL